MARRRQAESELVQVALKWLELKGIPAWQNRTGAIARNDPKYGRRYHRYGAKGSPDILGCLPPDGRLLALEAKVGSNTASDAQKAFLERIDEAGGVTAVFRTLEELQEVVALARALGPPQRRPAFCEELKP
jgi:hypothetical protein